MVDAPASAQVLTQQTELSAACPPAAAPSRVKVLLPLRLPGALDYLCPEPATAPEPGRFVRVSLGSRRAIGVVWDGEPDGAVPADRLKPLIEILPAPALRPEMRRFVDRVAAYTLAPAGAVLRMAMSVEEALSPPSPRRVCAPTAAGLAALA
jgi:primosomal protein N' (replication factor Y)